MKEEPIKSYKDFLVFAINRYQSVIDGHGEFKGTTNIFMGLLIRMGMSAGLCHFSATLCRQEMLALNTFKEIENKIMRALPFESYICETPSAVIHSGSLGRSEEEKMELVIASMHTRVAWCKEQIKLVER